MRRPERQYICFCEMADHRPDQRLADCHTYIHVLALGPSVDDIHTNEATDDRHSTPPSAKRPALCHAEALAICGGRQDLACWKNHT